MGSCADNVFLSIEVKTYNTTDFNMKNATEQRQHTENFNKRIEKILDYKESRSKYDMKYKGR